jgi:osmotically-inducible protein OsmY
VNRLTLTMGSVALALTLSGAALAATPAPDNSANNALNREGGARDTADEQSNSKADMELTQRIRRSVMDDKSLSMYGKNVKIVSSGGKVTLNGVVRTADEKQQIGQKAAAVAGAGHVVNELTVAPSN